MSSGDDTDHAAPRPWRLHGTWFSQHVADWLMSAPRTPAASAPGLLGSYSAWRQSRNLPFRFPNSCSRRCRPTDDWATFVEAPARPARLSLCEKGVPRRGSSKGVINKQVGGSAFGSQNRKSIGHVETFPRIARRADVRLILDRADFYIQLFPRIAVRRLEPGHADGIFPRHCRDEERVPCPKSRRPETRPMRRSKISSGPG